MSLVRILRYPTTFLVGVTCKTSPTNHTETRLQRRLRAERARQRRANEHADDTERRLSAERERRQQMRANESLDKRLENQREKGEEGWTETSPISSNFTASLVFTSTNSLSDNLNFLGDSVTLDLVDASISKPFPLLHAFTLQLAKLTALPSSLYFSLQISSQVGIKRY